MLTVYLLVSFKKFKFTTCAQDWCDLPRHYTRIKLEDVLSSSSLAAIQGPKPSDTSTASVDPDAPSFSALIRDPIDY